MVAAAARLSLVRPGVIPARAPRGQSARQLPSDRYVDHPGQGLTPQRVVWIYRLAEAGYPAQQCDLFDDVIENDGHLRNLLEQRCQAVAGKPFVVQGGGTAAVEIEAARVLDTVLRRLPMIEVWEHQLSFNRYGYAGSEIDWDVVNVDGRDWVVPVWFANVPARRFRIDARDQLRLLTADFATDGEELVPGKWMITRRSGARVARQALMRTGCWYGLFKRDTTGDWFIYAQKYGLPLTLVKYPEEGDETSKEVAEEIIANLSEDGGAMLPKKFEVDIHSEGRDGDSSAVHGGLINFCNRELSKLVNGSTLSNDNGDSGGASYSLGDVHDSVRWESVLYDAERLSESFRVHVATPFMRFTTLEGAAPILRMQVVRDLSPRQRAEIAEILTRIGMRVSESQLRQELGFREPLSDDDALAGSAAPAAPAPATGAAA